MQERETLSSRLGFLMLSVGCAVGLGNVWRFPYITGKYGGGMFVLLYLFFLALMGFPLLVAELSIGRSGQSNLVGSVKKLSNGNKFWITPFRLVFIGNFLLMMYYTVVSGWLLSYTWGYVANDFSVCKSAADFNGFFSALIGSPLSSSAGMLTAVVLSGAICSLGLRSGVEKTVKVMMMMLFLLIAVLAVKSLTLPGAAEGLKFFLTPNWKNFSADIGATVYSAMGQAFFTLSIGVGSIAIFGSYTDKQRSITGESTAIISIDTLIAIFAGLIIFPCCFSYGVNPGSGPGLIFISLPNTFANMAGGRWWGLLFFIFLSIAALTTVVSVFENIIAYLIDEWKMKRRIASLLVTVAVALCSLPCVFGFNIWSGVQPMGKGSTILDLEDFIMSQNLLPIGAFFMALFCSVKYGWGWKNFTAEANAGQGLKFPGFLKWYFRIILPILIAAVVFFGYKQLFNQ